MKIEDEVKRFKVDLLKKMPFYGDVVMRLPFIENKSIPTAGTDGGKIMYNPRFMSSLTRGELNFVLMHEVFHVILFHCKRNGDRNPKFWNVAADMVVNGMLAKLSVSMKNEHIPFDRPKDGIFSIVSSSETVENLYEKICRDNKHESKNAKTVIIPIKRISPVKVEVPDDIITGAPSTEGVFVQNPFKETSESPKAEGLSESMIINIIRDAAVANRSSFGSYYVPEQLYSKVESRKIKWQNLLRDFLVDTMSDEASYTTPERKYIHMDMILPGYARTEEVIEEIWAFVDSSLSIGKNEMSQFLTQLYRISKEFKCVFNICYWDTKVTDVYKNILKEDDIFKSVPHHSGGTDINCVYTWLTNNHVKPDVMLILTDGYFGALDQMRFPKSLKKKTILVLSTDITVDDDMKMMGKITRL